MHFANYLARQVHRASDKQTGETVALKMINTEPINRIEFGVSVVLAHSRVGGAYFWRSGAPAVGFELFAAPDLPHLNGGWCSSARLVV